MDTYIRILEDIDNVFPLRDAEKMRLMSYISAEYELISAGITCWTVNRNKHLKRVTTQLPIPGLQLITDDSSTWQELMAELGCIEVRMIADGQVPSSFDKCLYVYVLNAKVAYPKLMPLFFARVKTDSKAE